MIRRISKGRALLIVLVVSINFAGCGERHPHDKSEPLIKKVTVDSDLAQALGINLVKYEYDISTLEIPEGRSPWVTVWVELLQGDEKIKEWATPDMACGDSGSILLAYYKPPLFKNEKETIEAKVVYDSRFAYSINVSLDMPFRIQAHGGGMDERTIEMGKEYLLADIVEIYSPRGKGLFKPGTDTLRDKSENKALIMKVRFHLMEE